MANVIRLDMMVGMKFLKLTLRLSEIGKENKKKF